MHTHGQRQIGPQVNKTLDAWASILEVRMKLAIFLVTTLFLFVTPTQGYCETSILNTTGRGNASVYPDKAIIQFEIISKNALPLEAASETANIYDNVSRLLKQYGFDKEEIITIRFNVNDNWEQDPVTRQRKIVGYSAIHLIEIVVIDFSKIGVIVDAALTAGTTRVAKIKFSTTKLEDIQNIALEEAVKQAHRKAEIMAETVGGKLGKLIEMKLSGYDRDIPDTVGKLSTPIPTTIIPNVVWARTSVTAKWEYLPQGR